ncbi:16S rRNA (cytosine(967)-C(5))-methyltransferase [Altericista sp. CCNU0014]|uniref:16S rRNA (cytosine(967)-C(5))-methyltransferase n=1 Tax=Altericista sp. CCNU0014 TaxID=3082949 RepID=UPI00384FD293
MSSDPRQLAFITLKTVHKGAFADVALDRTLNRHELGDADRRLLTELVYGCVRRMRSLDALLDRLGRKPARSQPPDVRTVLHLGLYQLRYLEQIPPSAAVNTTVDLLKQNRMGGLSGFANGLLRQYLRLREVRDPLTLPPEPVERLGILHSYPDWIVQSWVDSVGVDGAEQLCLTLNKPPSIDLRINPLKTDRETVLAAFAAGGAIATPLPPLPQTLRIVGNPGPIHQLPGYSEGWWTVQEASAQLVGHLVDPEPGATIIDLCAAPGGKTTHLVELMRGQGMVWACDRAASRLKRLQQNLQRLQIDTVHLWEGDGRGLTSEVPLADCILIDAPCSGLGTLNRHADARWRQTPESVKELSELQGQLLDAAAQHLKPNGTLVYATCTLHPLENQGAIAHFLERHPQWELEVTLSNPIFADFQTEAGWIEIWPHQCPMDGFFMARLRRKP